MMRVTWKLLQELQDDYYDVRDNQSRKENRDLGVMRVDNLSREARINWITGETLAAGGHQSGYLLPGCRGLTGRFNTVRHAIKTGVCNCGTFTGDPFLFFHVCELTCVFFTVFEHMLVLV